MVVSVSLPAADIEFLDQYAESRRFHSRSAVLHQAVRLLRGAELGPAYEEAFQEWEESKGALAWDQPAGDGLQADAPG